MPSQLLLIDDDLRLTDMVGGYLRQNGFEVDTAGSLAAGRERLKQASYDALLLDLMLPDGDGLDFTRELRSQPRTRRLPLLMLTARGEPLDRIVGLEIGADDYLPKPFEPRELLARIRAVLRRGTDAAARAGSADNQKVMRFGALEIDRDARSVAVAGKPCELTSYQFDLLVALAERAGRVLSRDQIMEAVRGRELEAFDRSIDVHMGRIRNAIEVDAKDPKRILTVRGVGYVFAKQQD